MNFIGSFSGDYSFLSNMYSCRVMFEDIEYQCSESAFQAQKCPSRAEEFSPLNGFQAKKLGRWIPLRSDWEQVKLSIMKKILVNKFVQNPDLKDLLIQVPDEDFIEYNNWGDTYWGIDIKSMRGSNHLGILLRQVKSLFLK